MVGYCEDGVSAGIWVIHTGPKSGGELVMLFGSYCDDSVSAGIWVQFSSVSQVYFHEQLHEWDYFKCRKS